MSKQNIIDYVLDNTGVHSQQRLNQRNKSNWKKEFNLFLCPSCNKAFEYIKNTSTGRGRKLLKHDEFPRMIVTGKQTQPPPHPSMLKLL